MRQNRGHRSIFNRCPLGFYSGTGIGSKGYDKFSEIDGDICDIISDFGKRETGILDLYMLAFKLAKEQLKISKERLGGKIMNYAWDANRDGQNYFMMVLKVIEE